MEQKETVVQNLKRCILEAEMTLVGLGEDLQPDMEVLLNSVDLREKYDALNENVKYRWMIPYFKRCAYNVFASHIFNEAYSHLNKLLREKNYFVISLLTDDLIYSSGILQDRIVAPLGGYRRLRCEEDCQGKFYQVEESIVNSLNEWIENGNSLSPPFIDEPTCDSCGKSLVFDIYGEKSYSASGYADDWNRYQKWIQGTVNRKLCILELGVGMAYPSIIRWPFEKICFLNNKSQMFRIHRSLYHVAKENHDREIGLECDPMDFLALI